MRECIRKAAALKPDAILVEKSVSRVAQVRFMLHDDLHRLLSPVCQSLA